MSTQYEYNVTMTYNDGTAAEIVVIEATNPPQAKKRAEARYGGKAWGANQGRRVN